MRGCDTHPNFRTILFLGQLVLFMGRHVFGQFCSNLGCILSPGAKNGSQSPANQVCSFLHSTSLLLSFKPRHVNFAFYAVIIIIGANPKVALEIKRIFGAEKGCRGDAVLLHFYSPERQQTAERRVFHRERANESSTERANAQKPSGSSGPSGGPSAFF